MLRHHLEGESVECAPTVRVLVEDPAICSIEPDLDLPAGVNVSLCSGPHTASEPCPLVLDGTCPVGRPHVVVCGIDGPWARSVRAAWALEGVDVLDAEPDEPLADRVTRAVATVRARWSQ